MQSEMTRTGPFASPIYCLLLAAVFTLAFTLARATLGPVLGHSSPYSLYIAAVLIAGFARGGLCGFLVMLAGGAAGLTLFSGWDWTWTRASEPLVSLTIFWMVAGLVLMMANELRRHANAAFERAKPRTEQTRAPASNESQVSQRAA
jgi:K+-sensing histidine kinase KdpD